MSDNPVRTSRGRGRARQPSGSSRPGGLAALQEVSSNAGSGGSSGSDPPQSTAPPQSTVSKVVTTVTTTSSKSGDSSKFVQRPDFGKLGREIALRTNSFFVKYDNNMVLYRYDVDIKCDFRDCKLDDSYLVFWEANRQSKFIIEPYTAIYDGGKICYSTKEFVMQENEIRSSLEVDLPSFRRPVRYTIAIKYSGQRRIDFSNRETKTESLTVLEMVYRQLINTPEYKKRSGPRFAPYGANSFYVPQPGDKWSLNLDGGREAWCGYYLASRWATGMIPVLNIDISNGIFVKPQPVLAFMCEVFNQKLGRPQYNMSQLESLNKANPHYLSRAEVELFQDNIKGLMIVKEGEPNKTYKVRAISDQPADKMMFEWKQKEKTISVADYYELRYGPLKYPFFPCLVISQGKKRGDTLFPMEKCIMHSPQRVRGKLTEIQTATLIKGVCTDAVERARRIEEMMQLGSLCADPFAASFGFKLDSRMMPLNGRVMQPPALEYGHLSKIVPREGAWNMGNQTRLYNPASISSYGIVSFLGQNTQQDLQQFCYNLMSMCKQMGMHVQSPQPGSVVWLQGKTLPDLRRAMDSCVRECASQGKKCDMIIVPMPARSTADYGNVKGIAEQELGIITQVVLLRNIRQAKPQTLSNIVLKINAKMGGINCKLFTEKVAEKYLLNKPTLVLGLDVTHANPTERKMPSIGAAVGNIDLLPGKFCASINIQRYRGEPVVYLRKALDERVDAFWNMNKVKPERVIVFRDGVDDGYFEHVMTEECKSIRQACQDRVGKDFEPKITFIIVQKRHHTRFFCANQSDFSGRAKNVPPGTVVDKTVTHPNRYDFYLCSHFGIQGTSRPTHYTVLRDDNNFEPDEIQAITYQLCHIYFRCTRSVSIPAPTYYAHLACERARHHISVMSLDSRNDLFGDESSSVVTKSSGSSEESLGKSMNVLPALTTRMYFC